MSLEETPSIYNVARIFWPVTVSPLRAEYKSLILLPEAIGDDTQFSQTYGQ
jgi:hypothetical protein